MTADKYSPKWLLNKIKESKTDILEIIQAYKNDHIEDKQAINELFDLFSVGKNEAICNCENEYWKEDEGGDWYCTIHDKQA